jgi:hypothetical protein
MDAQKPVGDSKTLLNYKYAARYSLYALIIHWFFARRDVR